MTFVESRVLQLFSDSSELGWAEYYWSEQTQQWRYNAESEGFTHKHHLPYEFTEQERLLLAIKLSSN